MRVWLPVVFRGHSGSCGDNGGCGWSGSSGANGCGGNCSCDGYDKNYFNAAAVALTPPGRVQALTSSQMHKTSSRH